MLGDFGDHRIERGLEGRERDPRQRAGIDAEPGLVERGALVPAAGIGGEMLLDHQRAVEPAGLAAAEHMGEHFERLGLSPGFAVVDGGNEIAALQAGLGHPRVGQRHLANRDRRRLLGPHARTDLGAAGDLAIGLLDERPDLGSGHVAGDHHHRIIGRVEPPVKRERILAVELLDLGAPADHRPSIGMIEIERRGDLLAEPRFRAVGDPHVVLFQHHVALGQHIGVGEHEAGHAIGLELHHRRQVFAGDALEIAGVVGGGEGILLAADGGERLREPALAGSCRCP